MRPGQAANSCKAEPPKRTINIARRDSRSTLRSPVCSDRTFQFIEQPWIDGIDRINQRRNGGARRRAEKSADRNLRPSTLYTLSGNSCAIDERLPVPFALNQSLAAKPVDNLCNRRVDQALWFVDLPMQVTNGRRAELPQLCQNEIFQFIRG